MMSSGKKNLLLLLIVVALAVLPFLINRQADYSGADSKAQEAITEIAPGYQPWFKPLVNLPGETETLLFALQAALGAGFIGYFIGYKRGQAKGRDK